MPFPLCHGEAAFNHGLADCFAVLMLDDRGDQCGTVFCRQHLVTTQPGLLLDAAHIGFHVVFNGRRPGGNDRFNGIHSAPGVAVQHLAHGADAVGHGAKDDEPLVILAGHSLPLGFAVPADVAGVVVPDASRHEWQGAVIACNGHDQPPHDKQKKSAVLFITTP